MEIQVPICQVNFLEQSVPSGWIEGGKVCVWQRQTFSRPTQGKTVDWILEHGIENVCGAFFRRDLYRLVCLSIRMYV